MLFGKAMMEYKNYPAGPIDLDPEEKTFSGTVAGLRDVIHFEGRTATELERAFRESRTATWSFAPRPASSPTARSTERYWSAPNPNCTVKRP
jgi:predicted HicB family RNase H-like nuclease